VIRAFYDPEPPEPDNLLSRFLGQRILVVGDVMLDEYLWGDVRRICQEAPIPIVEVRRRQYVPGGAANVAANLASLGARVHLLGVVGDDEAGKRLREKLYRAGVTLTDLLVDPDRPTTTKTRIMVQNNQVARADHEDRSRLPASAVRRVLAAIDAHAAEVDACILSDYDKGFLRPVVAQRVIRRAAAQKKPVIVDPKTKKLLTYQGATVITPNLKEAARLMGSRPGRESIVELGRGLLARGAFGAVLITRGADGMSLFQPGVEPVHIAAEASEVVAVMGAGDTAAATLTMALAAGASVEEAARLANRAAGVIVGKVGTMAIDLSEI
jgi:D-glycero-beta-D-manno-heptose-7-phosphate kinase